MAGGAEALSLNPSGGQSQGSAVGHSPFDDFVRDHLATTLMTMQPRDGIASDAWCLADDREQSVLLYSLTGDSIAFDARAYAAPATSVSGSTRVPARRSH